MNKVQHPSNNRVLAPPSGWNQSGLQCNALPVTISNQNGIILTQSFWKPNAAELEAITCGHYIILTVVGAAMPPVKLEVEAIKHDK